MQFFFTGFMGCGKSFWGNALASIYQQPFIDLDKQLESQTQSSISIILQEKGIDFFRQTESHLLTHCIQTFPNFILSTGGGTPCYSDNMQQMKIAGIVIYLQATPWFLFERLKNDRDHRPLLANIPEEHLLESIEKLLMEREQFYTKAHYILQAETFNEAIFENIYNTHA